MLTVEVEFLHATFRGSSGDLALTGHQDPGEWPPSPARLFGALVAADGTRDRCRVTDGTELTWLESLGMPTICASPEAQVLRSPLESRYVVVNERNRNTVQEYAGRTSSSARQGTRIAPYNPRVAYLWEDVQLSHDTLKALRRRAARVGYLGSSDSPVRVAVFDGPPTKHAPETRWEPAEDGDKLLPIPFEGLVEVLDRIYDEFTNPPASGTYAPRRSGFRTELGRYRSPSATQPTARGEATILWLKLDRPISGRRVLDVTETLRRAVLDLYQRYAIAGDEQVPSVLTGHGFDGRGFNHASWLALPDVGYRHSGGRIHGLAIRLPPDTPDDVAAGVRTAVWHLSELVNPGVFSVGISPHDGEARPWAAAPERWIRAARSFSSAFPVVHDRFVRPLPSLEDIGDWCENAGLPRPIAARVHRTPRLPGALSLHPREARRAKDKRYPYSHMDLEFEQPVAGPVIVGRGRHFGLGLFAPMSDPRPETSHG